MYTSNSFNYIELNGTTQGGAGTDLIDLIKVQYGWFTECNLLCLNDVSNGIITPFKTYT